MCGITGKIYFNENIISPDDILAMNKAIIHRGPDDSGIYISPNNKVGMGHQRLSIIDLSKNGHQPMRYLDRYWIIFNGEIYNFQEKKDLLILEGYKFESKTDTEVILALYHKYREKCLDHLRGMFSFAIYDEKDNTIFCARDRVGKKPFKYYLDKNVFIFASELKAILTQNEYKKEPDHEAIYHYVTLQYCPTPLTGFKNIKKLEPGHFLLINLNDNSIKKECYWKLDHTKKLTLPQQEWSKKIIDKLEEAIKIRMVSDVPIGAFLSGGIDSSIVVAMMSKLRKEPIETFSIGYENKKYSELNYASIIADKFKTNHHELIVNPTGKNILEKLAWFYEEPFADSSALPSYLISEFAKKNVTVTLNGDGGDECFGGYYRYSIQKISNWVCKIPFAKNLAAPVMKKILTSKKNANLAENIFLFLDGLKKNETERYLYYMYRISENEKKNTIFSKNMLEKINTKGFSTEKLISNIADKNLTKNDISKIISLDIDSYLLDDLLPKIDIATMANSLETRSPFLDHEFLELTAQIPTSLKVKGFFNRKYILKKSIEKIIPKKILYRKKMGFAIPLTSWVQNDWKTYVEKKLLSEKFKSRDIFSETYIKNILKSNSGDKNKKSSMIWTLLMLELWFEKYFD